MIITGMAEYESVCKNALVKWYNSHNYSLKCHYYPIKEIRCKEMVLTIEDISAILYMR